jgi:hypothetical protein
MFMVNHEKGNRTPLSLLNLVMQYNLYLWQVDGDIACFKEQGFLENP